MNQENKKGFTLVELLVVIGILAILAAAVVVVLNPAELLKQARDVQRMSDLDAVRSAISLYLSTVSSPAFASAGPFSTSGTNCYSLTGSCTQNNTYAIDGTGWVAVNLGSMTNPASPISSLPKDPVNDANYHYAWKGDTTTLTFEMNANLESVKYSSGGANDREGNDGGNSTTIYEVGTDPGLDM